MPRQSVLWTITDTHFNSVFEKGRPPDFAQQYINNCRKVVCLQDILIHLGDVIDVRHSELLSYLGQIQCKSKILVRGNHDHQTDNWYLNNGFNFVCEKLHLKVLKQDVILSHIPVPLPHNFINIHGHFHDNKLERCFFYGPLLKDFYGSGHIRIAPEYTGYKPVSLDEIITQFKKDPQSLWIEGDRGLNENDSQTGSIS